MIVKKQMNSAATQVETQDSAFKTKDSGYGYADDYGEDADSIGQGSNLDNQTPVLPLHSELKEVE